MLFKRLRAIYGSFVAISPALRAILRPLLAAISPALRAILGPLLAISPALRAILGSLLAISLSLLSEGIARHSNKTACKKVLD
ncbi:hypothetical protein ACIQXW_18670 [Lysinibacillus sp. NPDC097162]|uniref:hypothetical protein n=1 Tax=Lysinibacillus sp. NPDC097162 TaxID=3364140 RepID=UPI0037F17506